MIFNLGIVLSLYGILKGFLKIPDLNSLYKNIVSKDRTEIFAYSSSIVNKLCHQQKISKERDTGGIRFLLFDASKFRYNSTKPHSPSHLKNRTEVPMPETDTGSTTIFTKSQLQFNSRPPLYNVPSQPPSFLPEKQNNQKMVGFKYGI